ncbi:hypothetical protein Cyrtocomes_00826 [Candidatus Cyrtobacter comes]|uniref:Uncharacterized protein n=2 Tax=Candidatus Cyrtobacter comes TaxID=675776 RepID=A0ABU5L8J8_9RICK|nr:hypothetical protein [Candidatus Cyrtobacter comes]
MSPSQLPSTQLLAPILTLSYIFSACRILSLFCMLILASSYNSTNTLFTTLHALALKDDVESQLALAYMYYGALERVAAMGL